ncbi:MAG: hypothetical protein NTY86_12840, partial [Deltaproteobacteria bacterium]|nr:hypothetical protein [Deltaproteobacteria bacterium]
HAFFDEALCMNIVIPRVVGVGRFSLLIFTGKLARYAAVAWLTLGGCRCSRVSHSISHPALIGITR